MKHNQRSIRTIVLFSLSVEVGAVSNVSSVRLVVSFSRQMTSHIGQLSAADVVCLLTDPCLCRLEEPWEGALHKDARSAST